MPSQIINEIESDLDAPPDLPESELFRVTDNKKLVLNLTLQTEDVLNPCKPWISCRNWAFRVLEEFFVQGDQEKALNVAVPMLHGREQVNQPISRIGLLDFIVSPMIAAEIQLFT